MAEPVLVQSQEQLESILSTNTYVLVDFWAEWCGPCHAIAPTYKKLSAAHSVPNHLLFSKLDVDEVPEVAAKYDIRAIPTFVLLKNGEVVETVKSANVPVLQKVVKSAKEDVERLVKEKKATTKEHADKETLKLDEDF